MNVKYANFYRSTNKKVKIGASNVKNMAKFGNGAISTDYRSKIKTKERKTEE